MMENGCVAFEVCMTGHISIREKIIEIKGKPTLKE